MKIAVFHELQKGGARRATNEFAKQLKKLGHGVDLFTIDTGEKFEEASFYDEINLYKFKPKEWKGHDWKVRLYKDTVELIKVFLLDRKIARDIDAGGYDLAFISASVFIESPFILQFLKIPKFFYCHDPYYRIIYEPDLFNKTGIGKTRLLYERVNRFFRKYIDKSNIKRADHIIFNSQFTKELFEKTYKISGKVSYIGVDTFYFKPKDVKKDIDLLYIGSHDFLDGYQLFKDTVTEIKSEVKIRTVFFEDEWLSDDQLLNLYRKSKILVATAFREPLGLVPLEAMSCGVVVVAVDDGAHKETIINNNTGFIVENNSKKMAEKIDWLLNNPEILKEMSINARKHVQDNWNWEKQGKELENILLKNYKR
jgi:glycosyltransferase involved in cell wall biosynthesis